VNRSLVVMYKQLFSLRLNYSKVMIAFELGLMAYAY